MATRTASAAQSHVIAKTLRVGPVAVVSSFSLAAAQSLSAGDVIQMVKIPSGATVVYLAVGGANGEASWGVGDGLLANRYLSTSTRTAGNGLVMMNQLNVPYTYTTDDTIDIQVTAASISTTTGGFELKVIYTMDPLVYNGQ